MAAAAGTRASCFAKKVHNPADHDEGRRYTLAVSENAGEGPRLSSLAFITVNPGTAEARTVPIDDLVVIGRECSGVDARHRLILDDEAVSRRHVELRLDRDEDRAWVFDTSTNGTRLNGHRIERASDVAIRPGDRLTVGDSELEFRADRFLGVSAGEHIKVGHTVEAVSLCQLAMVAGDIIGYSTISQYTAEDVLLKSIAELYGELLGLLREWHGTLNNYVGDAFFAIWELSDDPDAVEHALEYAVAAVDRVRELAPRLALRAPDDEPIRMGWGIEFGQAAISTLPGQRVTVLGDATNVAFRLSAAAGRDGRDQILVTSRVEEILGDRFAFEAPEDLIVKGRLGAERVFGVTTNRA